MGRIEVVAGERDDTVVTVSPTNPAKAADQRGAEETKVEFDGRRVTVSGPRPRVSWIGPTESVDLRIELPSGSRLTAELAVGGLHSSGVLGATRVKASMGPVEIDTAGDLDITADHGQIRVARVLGAATLKASHGSVRVGESSGEVDARLSYGDLTITTALGSVTAKTAYGTIDLDEVSGGSIQLESGYGQVTVGLRTGVAAWLDLASKSGHVRNELDSDRAPNPSEQTVSVRARTQYGDISIRRAR
ncbi:MAG: DUF4097 family beta strand repeat-containing protein [Actinomycetota bacterium]